MSKSTRRKRKKEKAAEKRAVKACRPSKSHSNGPARAELRRTSTEPEGTTRSRSSLPSSTAVPIEVPLGEAFASRCAGRISSSSTGANCDDLDLFEMAKDALKERLSTLVLTIVLLVAFFGILLWATPLAWGWECPQRAKETAKDWANAKMACGGCLRTVPHAHVVTVPVKVVIPGMKTIDVFSIPLCCICFRSVMIGTAKLTDVLDWAAVGEAAVRKEMEKKAKSAEKPKKAPVASTSRKGVEKK